MPRFSGLSFGGMGLVMSALALALVQAACRASPATEDGPRSPVAKRAPTTAPALSVTATASSEALPTAMPMGTDLPPRSGAPGSTLGTVACGKMRCKAPGESCGYSLKSGGWACVASKDPNAPLYHSPTQEAPFACDDASDCPSGEACCIRFDDVSFGAHSCVPRDSVPTSCDVEVCVADGAACPKDTRCVEGASRYANDSAVEGTCYPDPISATCAGKKKCPADKPVCVATKKGLECAAEGSDAYRNAKGDQRFLCTRQSDCNAGRTCQTTIGEDPDMATYCGNFHPGYRGEVVCEVGDPNFCGKDPECLAQFKCVHPKGYPPWMGISVSKEP